ncbi:MAG: SpoIIE family protein phosphatase [Peptococcaceae bacterium]|nr:SpoIIE family protein phosphatase [Peptococcaceae bacterium]
MAAIIGEVAIAQLKHHGEELCGDTVEIIRNPGETVVVLSDGLGSGVKANILSSLTAKICAQLIAADVPIEDTVDTLLKTLPTCADRGVAYSTFSIMRLYDNGVAFMVDFDGCPMIRISEDKKISVIETNPSEVEGKTIHETNFRLHAGETVVIVSDGVIQAGLGELLPFGLGIDGLVDTLERFVDLDDNVQSIAWRIVNICKSYYLGEPGDDTTAVVMRLKEEQRMVIMTGPPVHMEDDARMVSRFQSEEGMKIICGGTTAQIYARETGKQIHSDFHYVNKKIPPISYIDGVDLVTEGIITLSAVKRMLDEQELQTGEDGATLLMNKILASDHITFLQGMQRNVAMKDNLPLDLDLRDVIVEKLATKLRSMGKIVEIVRYE